MFNRKEMKIAAKKQLNGNIGVYFGLSIIVGLILSALALTFVGSFVLMGPFQLGFAMFFLEVVREGRGNLETGFKGFKQFGTAFVAFLLVFIFTSLWSLLFIIPGIIAQCRYAMTFFILADNPTISASDAMKKSKEMMDGHKLELFFLELSFFWWYILGIITFGLAMIYVAPYVETTIAIYYERLKAKQQGVQAAV